jgi:hypothetical protein
MKRTFLFVGIGILALILIGAGVIYAIGQNTPAEDPVQRESRAFPELIGTSLLLEQVRVPSALSGDFKLIVVSYDDAQQPDVDEWLPALENLNDDFPQIAGYYVPMLPKSAADSSFFIIGGMAAVAQNDTDRARTIVVFTNVDAFNQLVDVPNTDTIQLFLLDDDQKIIWQGSGIYNENTLNDLRDKLEEVS